MINSAVASVASEVIIPIATVEDQFKALCREYSHQASLNAQSAMTHFHDNDIERGRSLMQKANKFGNKALAVCRIINDISRCDWLLSDIKPSLDIVNDVLLESIIKKDTDFIGFDFIGTLKEDMPIKVHYKLRNDDKYQYHVYSDKLDFTIASVFDILLLNITIEHEIVKAVNRYLCSPVRPQEEIIQKPMERLFSVEQFF